MDKRKLKIYDMMRKNAYLLIILQLFVSKMIKIFHFIDLNGNEKSFIIIISIFVYHYKHLKRSIIIDIIFKTYLLVVK